MMTAKFSYFHLELNAGVIFSWLEQILRPVGAMNRSRQLQNSKVKYKFIFTTIVLGVTVILLKISSV